MCLRVDKPPGSGSVTTPGLREADAEDHLRRGSAAALSRRATSALPGCFCCGELVGRAGVVGEAQQSGDSTFEGFAGLGGVSEVSGCRCSVAEHDVVPGGDVWLRVAGGGEGVADERVEPGAVGEHGAHDRAVGVLEL